MRALVGAFFYQLLFSILGSPPHFRFGYASVVTFWVGFYIVVGDLADLAIKRRRSQGTAKLAHTARAVLFPRLSNDAYSVVLENSNISPTH